ncbi:MAG: ATP-binding protein [Lachnospiraceae bacterium]|nr:ATP-binding protein [Lachnospiraceae bacterium]MBR6271894.1 ATP-binding protein [Lachnospiraceae bacterium]
MQNGRIIKNTFYVQVAAMVAASVTSMLGSLIDGIIIGQYLGVDAIASFGIVSPLVAAVTLLGAVISSGARGRFVWLMGSGKTKEAQKVFSLSLIMAVALAAFITLVVIILSGPIASLLGATGNAAALMPKARAYLIGVSLGFPASSAMWVLWAFIPIDNDRNLPVIASLVMAAVNILLDFAVIFVFHGDTFEMGLVTSISYLVAVAVLLIHFLKKDAFLKLRFKKPSLKETLEILEEGAPSGVHRIGHSVTGVVMNRILAVIASSGAIAAYSVYGQTEALLLPIVLGVADTVSALSGVLAGEQNRPMIRRLLVTSAQTTFILTLLISALTWIMAPQLASWFISDNQSALDLSTSAVRAFVAGLPLHGLNLIYLDYIHGIGKVKLSALTAFFAECVFIIMSAVVLVFFIGAAAVWFAFPVAQVLLLIYYFIVSSVESRRMKIERENVWNRILLLPDSFDTAESERMDRSIASMEEVAALSQEVWSFCDSLGCDERRRYLISLAVEEMAGNVIKHGFSNDRKKHGIDIRVMKKGNDFIIRIRDDCLIFDPVKQLKLYSDEDPTHHIGLRMIVETAKEVRYTSLLRLNNLTIRI